MIHDIFFDCPQCNHTIKVSSDLVGVLVECPDCANEFKVPEIRDGLNPRLRKQQDSLLYQRIKKSEMMDDLLNLERGLRSLMRRQAEQIKQIEFIEGNATLILKQLRLMDVTPVPPQAESGATESSPEDKTSTDAAALPWLRYSLICGWVTLGILLVFGVMFFRAG